MCDMYRLVVSSSVAVPFRAPDAPPPHAGKEGGGIPGFSNISGIFRQRSRHLFSSPGSPASAILHTEHSAVSRHPSLLSPHGYSRRRESIQMVTGPSLTSATCMSAPNTPVATRRPVSASTAATKRS